MIVEVVSFAESIPTDWKGEGEKSFLDRAQKTGRKKP
jgi:hypothetical protein